MLQKGGFVSLSAWQLLPAHIEILLVGWTAQLAMGVAFWIFPRYAPLEPRTQARRPRGEERPVWLAFVLLNLGVFLTAFGVLLGMSPWVRLVGRGAVAIAVLLFAWNAWGRVRPVV